MNPNSSPLYVATISSGNAEIGELLNACAENSIFTPPHPIIHYYGAGVVVGATVVVVVGLGLTITPFMTPNLYT